MSKTPALSRRAMLGSFPAAALATAAVLPAAAMASEHDAELLALADRMEVAHAATISFDNFENSELDIDACVIAEDDLALEIAQVSAKTLAGLKVKVRALFIIGELQDKQWGHPETWEYEFPQEGLVLSLMEDILAMEG